MLIYYLIRDNSFPSDESTLFCFFFVFQIRSDKENFTKILYFLSGPGVDEEPKNVFGIDHNTGYVRVYSILDREKVARYQVQAFFYILFFNTIKFAAWILKL